MLKNVASITKKICIVSAICSISGIIYEIGKFVGRREGMKMQDQVHVNTINECGGTVIVNGNERIYLEEYSRTKDGEIVYEKH